MRKPDSSEPWQAIADSGNLVAHCAVAGYLGSDHTDWQQKVAYNGFPHRCVTAHTLHLAKMPSPAPTRSTLPSRTGSALVVLQFVGMVVIALHARPALQWWPSAIFLGLSGLMMVASVVAMGRKTLRAHPHPADAGKLQTRGIYRLLRHPMYSALLIASLAVLWTHPVWPVVLASVMIALVVRAKIVIEERELSRKFPAYRDYAQRVPAVIPFYPRKQHKVLRTIIWITILAPSLWLPFETCWDTQLFPATGSDSDATRCVNLSTSAAKSLLDRQHDTVVIDVRSEWEARNTRLPGALRSGSSIEQLEALTRDFDRDRAVLVYCTGGFRSRLAIDPLKQLGFRKIYHLDRGIMAWQLARLPTETATARATAKTTSKP